jgi:5'-nucleotidase
MRLLLTNDDGIAAPGLAVLAELAAAYGEVVVVAPASEHSGSGHQVTTRSPIAVEQLGVARWKVHGTPGDCVRLALHGLCGPVDWVLSGINPGGNLGTDIYHSGTVAAAREAALHGVPGLAISQLRRRDLALDWERTRAALAGELAALLQAPPPPACYWNLNLPHPGAGESVGALLRCPLDPSPLPLSFTRNQLTGSYRYDGDYHLRQRQPGSDVERCMAGFITLTELRL